MTDFFPDRARPPPAFMTALPAVCGERLPPGSIEKLGRFVLLLLDKNRSINLTGAREPEEAWMRHILDSLTLSPYLVDGQHVADIGSGGGFPGLPLAVIRPAVTFTLIEATGKKARFLSEAVTSLSLENVYVEAARAERLARQTTWRASNDVVTGRAVGELRVFLELAAPLARNDGRLLVMKGRGVEAELEAAQSAFRELRLALVAVHTPNLPGEPGAVVLEIKKIEPTPDRYPRAAGKPRQRPL